MRASYAVRAIALLALAAQAGCAATPSPDPLRIHEQVLVLDRVNPRALRLLGLLEARKDR